MATDDNTFTCRACEQAMYFSSKYLEYICENPSCDELQLDDGDYGDDR